MIDESAPAPARSTGGGFNPIPVLVHVVAIAAGIFLGLQAMDAIAPDLPSAEPGVSSSAAPGAVSGDDPDSLFQPENLGLALVRLEDQIAAGEGLLRLRISPGSLDVESATGDGLFDPDDVSAALPSVIVDQAQGERPRVGLADVGYMELVATEEGPRWYVQLDTSKTDVSPPWTYGAPLSGTPLEPGGPAPMAIGEARPAPPVEPEPPAAPQRRGKEQPRGKR